MPYRPGRSTRSGRPGAQADQDELAGLPVRQWRPSGILIGDNDDSQAPSDPIPTQPNEFSHDGIPEKLMPKGSEQYAPWLQQLLRAARAGRAYTRTAQETNGNGKHDAGKEKTSQEGNEEEDDTVPRGQKRNASHAFTAMRWAQVPRHLEEQDHELLAKRRKGLPSLRMVGAMTGVTPMRKTMVKRADAEGNPTVFEVMVPQGATVEGEVSDLTTLADVGAPTAAPAPGTVVAGLGVANADGIVIASEGVTPIRRKGPDPSKRKKKKHVKTKKMDDTPGMGVSASAEDLEARQALAQAKAERLAAGEKEEDVEMGEDGREEDDDSSEDGDEDREDGELSPTPDPDGASAEVLTEGKQHALTEPKLESELPSQTQPQVQPQQLSQAQHHIQHQLQGHGMAAIEEAVKMTHPEHEIEGLADTTMREAAAGLTQQEIGSPSDVPIDGGVATVVDEDRPAISNLMTNRIPGLDTTTTTTTGSYGVDEMDEVDEIVEADDMDDIIMEEGHALDGEEIAEFVESNRETGVPTSMVEAESEGLANIEDSAASEALIEEEPSIDEEPVQPIEEPANAVPIDAELTNSELALEQEAAEIPSAALEPSSDLPTAPTSDPAPPLPTERADEEAAHPPPQEPQPAFKTTTLEPAPAVDKTALEPVLAAALNTPEPASRALPIPPSNSEHALPTSIPGLIPGLTPTGGTPHSPPPPPEPAHAELPPPLETEIAPVHASVEASAEASKILSSSGPTRSPQRPETEALTPDSEEALGRPGDVRFEDGEVDLLGTVAREDGGM